MKKDDSQVFQAVITQGTRHPCEACEHVDVSPHDAPCNDCRDIERSLDRSYFQAAEPQKEGMK